MPKPVVAIFDIGKTNKKVFLFDEDYRVVYETSAQLAETTDEDEEPCEDLAALEEWFDCALSHILSKREFDIRAINFATYGASFVLVDVGGKAIPPLYNYLKKFPAPLLSEFYATYGDRESFAALTASPPLGNLNSGLQLFRIKQLNPEKFSATRWALHLPQFMSFILTKTPYSDLTSIGCHTALWDFTSGDYHDWVNSEGIKDKLAPIINSAHTDEVIVEDKRVKVGVGLHDSSAALIPYLKTFSQPFVLISTGTWAISLNPFNHSPLTKNELENDCLCYLQYNGKQVKASRLFAGHFHDEQVARIAKHFNTDSDFYKPIRFTNEKGEAFKKSEPRHPAPPSQCVFASRDLSIFENDEEAYDQLMIDLVWQQVISTKLVLNERLVKDIFVDGGFCNNDLFMHFLAIAFSDKNIFAAKLAQATALGAALAIHESWNKKSLPDNLIELKSYSFVRERSS